MFLRRVDNFCLFTPEAGDEVWPATAIGLSAIRAQIDAEATKKLTSVRECWP